MCILIRDRKFVYVVKAYLFHDICFVNVVEAFITLD